MNGTPRLEGLHVVWTGLRESGDAIIEKLEQEGAIVLREPLLRCIPAQSIDPLPMMRSAGWAVFTSGRAVEAVFGLGLDLSNLKIAAVGSASADKLRTFGCHPDLVPDDMRAEGLADAMTAKAKPPVDVIFFRGDKALTTLPDRLRKAGFHVEEREVYTTVEVSVEKARQIASRIRAQADVAIFGSPSGVQVLNTVKPLLEISNAAPRLLFAALGPVTAAALRAVGIERPIVASSPKPDEVARAIALRIGKIR